MYDYEIILFCHFQCTEIENDDKQDLIEAVTIMADVAAFINESKRRKDIGNYRQIHFYLRYFSDILYVIEKLIGNFVSYLGDCVYENCFFQ